MEVSITTISKNGQIVIPFAIRKALGIGPSEKFLVVSEGDTIVLKRLKKERLKKELEGIFSYFSDAFSDEGITKEEIQKEIRDHRKGKRSSYASGS
jgi:AbrB family looped-hinge helix DNA binding protein